MNGIDPAQQAELEAAIESDPGAPGFAALAELHRRAGRLREAEQVARRGLERSDTVEGRLVLALALLEQGREDDARRELVRLLGDRLAASGFSFKEREDDARDTGLSDDELEVAFHQAETDAERLITPNRVAEEALAYVDAGAVEGLDEGVLEPGSAFATATMAELLARQGDARGAERIRASLERKPRPASPASPARADADRDSGERTRRERRVARLERWLANIRGGRS